MATEQKEIKKKVYSVLKDVGENDKCPPQAKLILNTIKAAGGKMSREDLIAALKRAPEQGGLKTTQTPERILGFYKPKLETDGYIQEDSVSEMVTVEVADKPAKAPKAPKADSAVGEASMDTPAKDKVKGAKGEQKTAA